jgi:hypothetical protein
MQVILGEEVAQSKLTLFEISRKISDAVQARAEQGLNFLNFNFPVFKLIFLVSLELWIRVNRNYMDIGGHKCNLESLD